MAAKNKVTVSTNLPNYRASLTERRAAMTAAIANEQQGLKREAAERRAKRAREDAR
jgi:hypothetical protein